jgi:hypothetical protein
MHTENNKYKYLILIVAIRNNKEFKQIFSNNHFTYQYLFKSFKNVCVVDINNLVFFKKKNNLDKTILKNFFPRLNIKFFSFNRFKNLHNFLKRKKIVVIKKFGNTYGELPLNMFLKFYDLKLITIGNSGNRNIILESSNNLFKLLKYFLVKKLAHKITVFLSMIGLVRKIDIRFISNPDFLRFNNQNFLNKLAKIFKLPYAKELIPINSKAYDICKITNIKTENNYISVLDEQLNDPHWTRFRDPIKKKNLDAHYKKFNLYLKKLSKILKKKVVICIHPNDNFEEKKKIFKSYKVVKYRTREFIYKSFLVVFFESSAIVDAILLNKNITTIHSKILDKNQLYCSMIYVNGVNAPISNIDKLYKVNLTKSYLFKKNIIKNKNQIFKDYEIFKNKYLCAGINDDLGVEVIKKTIRYKYNLK